MSKNSFSVVIISFNEENRISATVQAALAVTDDVIVVDSLSKDRTVALATALGAKVFQQAWSGYSAQKNFGNAQAKYDWILSIDADEVISTELAQELKRGFTAQEANIVWEIPFRTNYCGQWIRHGAWKNEKHIRLFNKQKVSWNANSVHEGLALSAETIFSSMKGPILHYSIDSLEKHLEKINHYTTLQAEALLSQGRKPSLLKMMFSPLVQFIRAYFFQLGFLDGFYGFLIAVQRSNYFFLRYAKARIKHDQALSAQQTKKEPSKAI